MWCSKDQDQYHIANIRAIFFQNIIYVNICKFEFNWKLKWHDTDFGKENAANGTPYVLLESDMKKKWTILKKAKNEDKLCSTDLQPIYLCYCRGTPYTLKTWDLSTESDKHWSHIIYAFFSDQTPCIVMPLILLKDDSQWRQSGLKRGVARSK